MATNPMDAAVIGGEVQDGEISEEVLEQAPEEEAADQPEESEEAAASEDEGTPAEEAAEEEAEEEAEEVVEAAAKDDESLAAIKEYVAKHHGGSTKDFLESIQGRQDDQTPQRLAQLEQTLSGLVERLDEAEEEIFDPASSDEVQELDAAIKTHSDKLGRLQQSHRDALKSLANMGEKIAFVQGKLDLVPEEDRGRLEAEIERRESDRSAAFERVKDKEEKLREHIEVMERAEKAKDRAISKAQKEWETSRRSKQDEERQQESIRNDFDSFYLQEAKKLGMDDSEVGDGYLRVKREFLEYLDQQPEDGSTTRDSMQQFIAKRAKAYDEYLAQRAAKRSGRPVTKKKPAPASKSKPAPKKKEKEMTAQEWRDWGARRSAQGR